MLFVSTVAASAVRALAWRLERRFGVEAGTMICTLAPAGMWLTMAVAVEPVLAPLRFVASSAFADMRGPILAVDRNRQLDSASRATALSLITNTGTLPAAAEWLSGHAPPAAR